MKKIFLFAGAALAVCLAGGCASSYYTISADDIPQITMETAKMEDVQAIVPEHPYKLQIEEVILKFDGKTEKCPEIADFIAQNQGGLFAAQSGAKTMLARIEFEIGEGKRMNMNKGLVQYRLNKCPSDPSNNARPSAFEHNCLLRVEVDGVVGEKPFVVEEYIRPIQGQYYTSEYPSRISAETLKEPAIQYLLADVAGKLDKNKLTERFAYRPKRIK